VNRTVALSIGFAMICFGAALFFFTRSFLPYHVLGILLIMAGPMVTARLRGDAIGKKAANAYALAYERQWQNLKRTWPLGAAIVGTVALSFYLLHLDAVSGGGDVFPVLFFAASGFVLMGYMIYLLAPQRK
jgi:hypothetical protein